MIFSVVLKSQTDNIYQIIFLILTVLTTVLALRGGARHIFYLSTPQIRTVVRLNWMAQPFGIMALATAKISVAFVTMRLLGPQAIWRKWFLYFSMISVFIINALCSIFSFVQCDPPRALWEKVPGAKCWDPRSQSDYSIFTSSMCVNAQKLCCPMKG